MSAETINLVLITKFALWPPSHAGRRQQAITGHLDVVDPARSGAGSAGSGPAMIIVVIITAG